MYSCLSSAVHIHDPVVLVTNLYPGVFVFPIFQDCGWTCESRCPAASAQLDLILVINISHISTLLFCYLYCQSHYQLHLQQVR